MALGRRRFTRAILERPPLVLAASGDAQVDAEAATLTLVAIVPTVTGDTPAPAGYVHAGAATQNPVQITTDDDDVAVLLALLLT